MKGWVVFLLLFVMVSSINGSLVCTAADRSEKTIPDSMVNDNYCDCPINGEDEPATSACAHTVKSFTCVGDVNKKTIPLSFVRDGICDCCDGQDEAPGVCKDVCEEEKANKIKKAQDEIKLHLDGEDMKKQYVKKGKDGVKKLDSSLKQFRKEIKKEEEDFQKLYTTTSDQQLLQRVYSNLLQKKHNMQTLEKLNSSPNSFGTRREYFPLLDACFTKVSNEKEFKGGSFEHVAKDFKFEVCPFRHILQHDVSDPSNKPTNLGFWQDWDEDTENVMIYSGGDECWNGPKRMVRMKLECGVTDALIEVRENGKCTYEFVFSSPAACSKKHADKLKKYVKSISPAEKEEIVHDEL